MTAPDAAHPADTTSATITAPRGRTRLRRLVTRSSLAAGVVATIVFGGAAIAAWNVTGEGTGTAGAATVQNLTFVELTIVGSLFPGVTTDAELSVTNPNPFPVLLTAITFDEITVSPADEGCDSVNAEVEFDDVTEFEEDLVIPATTDPAAPASETFTLADIVTMGPGAADACQQKTFTVTIDLTAESFATP